MYRVLYFEKSIRVRASGRQRHPLATIHQEGNRKRKNKIIRQIKKKTIRKHEELNQPELHNTTSISSLFLHMDLYCTILGKATRQAKCKDITLPLHNIKLPRFYPLPLASYLNSKPSTAHRRYDDSHVKDVTCQVQKLSLPSWPNLGSILGDLE